jgi:hypothetical protein
MDKFKVYFKARGSVVVEAENEDDAFDKAICLDLYDHTSEWDYEVVNYYDVEAVSEE